MRRLGRGGGLLSAPVGSCFSHDRENDAADKAWRESIYEIALQQLLADDAIHERTKQVFVRLAVDGEKPEAVAASFGIKRGAVDMMKVRCIKRLQELVEALRDA